MDHHIYRSPLDESLIADIVSQEIRTNYHKSNDTAPKPLLYFDDLNVCAIDDAFKFLTSLFGKCLVNIYKATPQLPIIQNANLVNNGINLG